MSRHINHNPTMPKVAKLLMQIEDRPDIALAIAAYRETAIEMSEVRGELSYPEKSMDEVMSLVRCYDTLLMRKRDLLLRLEQIAAAEKSPKQLP